MKRVAGQSRPAAAANRIRPASERQQQAPAADDEAGDPPVAERSLSHAFSLAHSAISVARRNRCNVETMLFDAMDLGATFVFAISGATRGVRRRLDLFGVLVVAWAAAVAGGIARDLLIGAVPPAAIADWRYLAAAVAAGLLGFFASDLIGRLKTPVLLFDAAGLCLFAVTGTQKALAYGLNPVMAAILGMITCIGGGVARDLLTLQVPTVLRAELYAVAALAGAGSIALGFAAGAALLAGGPVRGRAVPFPAADVDLPGMAPARRRPSRQSSKETD